MALKKRRGQARQENEPPLYSSLYADPLLFFLQEILAE